MAINEFRSRITVKKYVFAKDDTGGNIKMLTDDFDLWAKLENANGSRVLDNLQLTYSKAFKITTRFERTRLIRPFDEITYQDQVFIIQSVTQIEEGRDKYNVMLTYSTGAVSNSAGVINVAQYMIYTGTGTEYQITDSELEGWEIIIVFRDGEQYRVITSGIPSGKQVLYDSDAGTLDFDTNIAPLDIGEQVDVYGIS